MWVFFRFQVTVAVQFFVNCSNSLLVTCINESKQNDLLESRISPGSNAAVAFTKPLPISKGVAGDWFVSGLAYARWASMGPPPLSYTDAVVESADPIAAGVNVGNFCLIKAARPATCGAAMLVPDIIAKLSPKKCLMQSCLPRNSIESVPPELQAAHIEFPGATMFGFRISASSRELSSGSGPRAE
nr:GDP-fucose protein O-fucosyltransferase [Ipomoea batatas]